MPDTRNYPLGWVVPIPIVLHPDSLKMCGSCCRSTEGALSGRLTIRTRVLDTVCIICLALRNEWPKIKLLVNKGDRWDYEDEPEELNLIMVYKERK